MSHWDIIVTHARPGFRTTGPRHKVPEFTLTNLRGSEIEAQAEFKRCISEHPNYKLRLNLRKS